MRARPQEEIYAVQAATDLTPGDAADEGDAFALHRVNMERANVVPLITREGAGISPVDSAPDPIRQGDTPSRHPMLYVRREDPTYFETPEDNIPPSGIVRTLQPAPLADMPVGMFMFPDGEHRRLDDGRHA